MDDIFTENSNKVLALAKDELNISGHNFIGTENILAGLITLNDGLAAEILGKFGVTIENVRYETEKLIGRGAGFFVDNPPFTPRVTRVLSLAEQEAKFLNSDFVDTEHILLGILKEGDGVAVRVLENLNVDLKLLCEILHGECSSDEIKKFDSVQLSNSSSYADMEIPDWLKKDEYIIKNDEEKNLNFLVSFFRKLKSKFRPEEDGISKKI